MTYLTRQEILDKVVSHFEEQGGPGVDKRRACTYHAEDGKKCAIGVLIPDNLYSPDMEDLTFKALVRRYAAVLRDGHIDPIKDFDFLSSLQLIHDSAAVGHRFGGDFMRAFMGRLRYLAVREGLVIRSN